MTDDGLTDGGGRADGDTDDSGDGSRDRDDESTTNSSAPRSTISDELEVPNCPPNPDETAHVLPDEKLAYPEFAFDNGEMAADGSFDLEQSLDRDELGDWLADLAAGLESHDVAVSTTDEIAIFGVGSGDAAISFEPDDTDTGAHTGTLEVTFSLNAKLMTFSDDPDERRAGARAGEGFIPLEMLTSDAAPSSFRCYNWIDDPLGDSTAASTTDSSSDSVSNPTADPTTDSGNDT
ncbi:amphi-Trp domain-containing protein [Natrialba hulunbeirensis]|nr:amphi-Trp domain-containing protein [Natrialba hulunbeirensis]